MAFDDDEMDWRDECFRLMRVISGVIAEYSPMIADPNTPAGWALTDLRDVNHDLLVAIENCNDDSAAALLLEARVLLVEVVRLAN